MISPIATQIENRENRMKTAPQWLQDAQVNVPQDFGYERINPMGLNGMSPDFLAGYKLGLQTGAAIAAESTT